ncbi:MAG TPA: phosphotransferase [Pyrinomonadaceae bacterium]|jgi:aminoglycoside 2''-phosphotransferase|nr:phosphotransferase [Pyrinomonadaceae bacterium]
MPLPERYKTRIGEILPQVIKDVEFNDAGLMNDIVFVNGEFVFRFPKHEHALKHLRNEAKLLEFLQGKITLQIPEPFFVSDDAMAYRLISGETLRRDRLLKLGESEQQKIADQMAQFFKELHGVDAAGADFEIPPADALVEYEGWVGAYARIKEKVFPLLMPHVRDFMQEHFEDFLADENNFTFETKMVDTDIPPYHIMFDGERKVINGIIDLGCAGLGDPASDFSVIVYNYGEGFYRRFFRLYPEAEQYLKRARFYAGAQEVRWILTGIERNDNWWLTVHTSGAKAFGY